MDSLKPGENVDCTTDNNTLSYGGSICITQNGSQSVTVWGLSSHCKRWRYGQ